MNQKLSRRDLLKGSAALGLTAISASVKAAAPEPTAITPSLVEAAKKEGKVVFYSSMDLSVGEKLCFTRDCARRADFLSRGFPANNVGSPEPRPRYCGLAGSGSADFSAGQDHAAT